jgi:hypothetical protein
MPQRALVIALLAGAFSVLSVPAASAQGFGVAGTCTTPTTGTNTAPNQPCWVAGLYSADYRGTDDTDYYTQAGGHPFEGVTDFTVANTGGVPSGNVTSIRVDIPPGLISNPQAVPECSQSNPANCSSASQLGVVELDVVVGGVPESLGASVYNMVPPTGKVSDYAFEVPVAAVRTDIIGGIRSGSEQLGGLPSLTADDGLYFTIAVPSSVAELIRSTLIFWGDPGDSAHAPDLGWSCESASSLTSCTPPASAASDPAGTPFLTLPSGCLPAGQVSTLTLTDSSSDVAQATSKTPVAATGCDSVAFDPSLTLTPTTTQADAPTGLRVDLHVPQDENPKDLATSTLQTAVVTLPPGMTLDPSGANGLAACSPAQFALGSDAVPRCPAGSQVATVEIDTPLLPEALTGAVYLGCDGSSAQTPCTPSTPGGPLTASLYVYATAPAQGIDQKLVGAVTTNPLTGQVTTTFADQPPVPFSDFVLNFDGGPTATVANPLACGTATTASSLAPYSGNAAATPSSSFTVDANGAGGACPQLTPFVPGFSVKTNTLQAGAFDSPLIVSVTRADQQQYLGRIAVALPQGLLGVIASVPECPASQASDGSCAAASEFGTTSVLAGAGTDPISQSGTVYLTGPYDGAPFGLSIVVPAIAGPFDLGTVVVRAAINVDPTDAHVTITSDPLPQIVGGVPLRIRGVSVTIDRPAFILNPTSCAPLAIDATITSAGGARAAGSNPLQATGCNALPFAPTLRIALTGNDRTTSGRHPTLTATIGSALGQANVRSASVTLPLSLALDPNNSEHVCSVTDSQSDSCPADTAIGTATAVTPLLSQALTGTVYLVQGIRTNTQGQQIRTLPSLLVPLRGQVAIDLRGQTSVDSRGRLVTTFPAVPDAAISRFTLTITGGSRGILVVTGRGDSLCARRQLATAAFGAQSGASESLQPAIGVPCAKRAAVRRLAVTGDSVRVLVVAPMAGLLRAGAPGLVSSNRRIPGPRRVWLALQLTHYALARLQRQGKLRTRIRIRYTPAGWPTETILTRAVTIRR